MKDKVPNRKKPKRSGDLTRILAIRVSPQTSERVDEIAEARQTTQSTVGRELLEFALKHAPKPKGLEPTVA